MITKHTKKYKENEKLKKIANQEFKDYQNNLEKIFKTSELTIELIQDEFNDYKTFVSLEKINKIANGYYPYEHSIASQLQVSILDSIINLVDIYTFITDSQYNAKELYPTPKPEDIGDLQFNITANDKSNSTIIDIIKKQLETEDIAKLISSRSLINKHITMSNPKIALNGDKIKIIFLNKDTLREAFSVTLNINNISNNN